jgi:ubiquinone/menaquinone biosynthesis C-methylase UbiE
MLILWRMPTEQTEVSGFRAQFRNPKGFFGRIAGLLMVMTNRRINRFVVEMLDVQEHDRVLEIGFGPGVCIAMLADRAINGLVVGVDPSPTMLAQAGARNRIAVHSGRVELKVGSVSAIPYPDESFDKVCSINNIYFWPSRGDDLREIRRVMKDFGTLALAFRIEPNPASPSKLPSFDPVEVKRLLAAAGFRDARAEERETAPWTAACVLARK